jgi:hypothetical protein
MGRPDGVASHTLPAGRYRPLFEDDQGVYFESPSGITVTEPLPRGTRARPGGVYVPKDSGVGPWEYLGDAGGVSDRQQLPRHCTVRLDSAPAPSPEGQTPPNEPASGAPNATAQ